MSERTYKQDGDYLVDSLTGDWFKDACLGIVLKSLKELNYDSVETQKVVEQVKCEVKSVSLDEVIKTYREAEF